MSATPTPEVVQSLRRLGFSEIEALVYCDLLQHPGSTGYRVGKSIKRPHANVYQGLVALEARGAVLFEEGETRIYTAVPAAELVGHLQKRFQEDCEAAATALEDFSTEVPEEDRVFRLTSRDQAFARARAMLREAEETVLIEAFPGPIRELRVDLQEAAKSGLRVAGMVLRPEDQIEGTNIHVSNLAQRVLEIWRCDQLTLIVDARQFMLALFDDKTGELRRGIWVSSPYLAPVFNNGIVADVIMHTQEMFKDVGSPNKLLFGRYPPAVRDLLGLANE
jgi:HTH-type transcriptional regulator, sugar sensing transcriptional regulator